MAPRAPATATALPDPIFTGRERLARASFLAGYRALTRDAYALDLRQFVAWCERHGLTRHRSPGGSVDVLSNGQGDTDDC